MNTTQTLPFTQPRWLLATALAYVFVVAFDWIWHGQLLMGLYDQTANLWRPMAEMEAMMPWHFLGTAVFVVMFAWIFTKGYEGKGAMEGLRYGLFLAALMTGINIGWFAYMPIPMELLIGWVGGTFLQYLSAGLVIAWFYRPRT